MNIGKRIKEFRLGKGYKATDFAKIANISRVYLSEIERGVKTPSFDTLQKICNILDISLANFFNTGEDVMPPEYQELLENVKTLSPKQLKSLNDFLKTLKE